MKILLKRKTYACRTAEAGRKDLCSEFEKPRDLKLQSGMS
jgi:hypothetical protein